MTTKLSALLVQDRVVSFRQMDAAVQRQHQYGGRIGTNLLELGYVDEGILLYYVSKQRHMQALDNQEFAAVDPEALAAWDAATAAELLAIPIGLDDTKLRVAVAEALPDSFVASYQERSGVELEQLLALEFRIQQALQAFHEVPIPDRFIALAERMPIPMSTTDGSVATTGAHIALSARHLPSGLTEVTPSFDAEGDEIPGLAWTGPQLAAFFETNISRDHMLLAALGFAGKFFSRRMLFLVTRRGLRGFALQMPSEPARPIEKSETPIAPDSPLGRLISGESYFFGPLDHVGLDSLYDQLGLSHPPDVCAIPVKVGPRAALLLVGDAGEDRIEPQALPIIFLAVNRLADGLERLIRRRKVRRSTDHAIASVVDEAPSVRSRDVREQTDRMAAVVRAQREELISAASDAVAPVQAGLNELPDDGWDFDDAASADHASVDGSENMADESEGTADPISPDADAPAPDAAATVETADDNTAAEPQDDAPTDAPSEIEQTDDAATSEDAAETEADAEDDVDETEADVAETEADAEDDEDETEAAAEDDEDETEAAAEDDAAETEAAAEDDADETQAAAEDDAAETDATSDSGETTTAGFSSPPVADEDSDDEWIREKTDQLSPVAKSPIVADDGSAHDGPLPGPADQPDGSGTVPLAGVASTQSMVGLDDESDIGSAWEEEGVIDPAADSTLSLIPADALTPIADEPAVVTDGHLAAIPSGSLPKISHQIDTSSFQASNGYEDRVTGAISLFGLRRRKEESGDLPAVPSQGRQDPIDLDVRLPGVLQPPLLREPESEEEIAFANEILNADDATLISWLTSKEAARSDAAFMTLLDRGQDAYDALVEVFPGPLTVDRSTPQSVMEPKPLERHGPVVWLLALQLRSAYPRLRELTRASDPNARYYAARLLDQAADVGAIELMADLLFDTDSQVRDTALSFIDKHLTKQDRHLHPVLPTIRERLEADEPWVVDVAITVAGRLRDSGAVSALLAALDASSARTRQKAAQALSTLTFQDFGVNRRRWQKWFRRNGTNTRNEWLLDAMVDREWKVRDNAGRELRSISGLIVNYSPDFERRQLEAARRTVHRYAFGRDGGPV